MSQFTSLHFGAVFILIITDRAQLPIVIPN